MNDPENQFDDIAQLLRLKRHEQPPPGYLDRLPERILARIEAEETARRAQPGWLAWLGGTPARITLGIGAAAAFALTTALWMPEDMGEAGVAAGVSNAGLPLESHTPSAAEPLLAVPVGGLYAGNDTNPLAPLIAPDTAPAGLFNPSGFIGTNYTPPAQQAGFPDRR
jgi:hypothetical protein